MARESMMSPATLGLLLGFLGVVAFGGTFPMSKLAVAWFDPVFVTFGRAGLAGLLALGVLVVLRRPLPERQWWLPLGLSALCLVWGFPGLTNFAMRLVESSHAGVVAGILPLGTAVAAAIILKDRQRPAFWAVSILGMLVVVAFAMRGADGGLSLGDGLVLVSVAVASTGYVFSAQVSKSMPGWEVISWILVATLPLNLVGMAVSWPGVAHFAAAPAPALFGFLYVTLISQYLGFFAWNAGLALGGVARVGQVQLLQTFVTLIFAATLAGERVAPEVWGVAAIVVGLVIVARRVARS
jgi:drug/metabolite transporter (DMT)-like permease